MCAVRYLSFVKSLSCDKTPYQILWILCNSIYQVNMYFLKSQIKEMRFSDKSLIWLSSSNTECMFINQKMKKGKEGDRGVFGDVYNPWCGWIAHRRICGNQLNSTLLVGTHTMDVGLLRRTSHKGRFKMLVK